MLRGYISTDNKCIAPLDYQEGCSGMWTDYELVNVVEGGSNLLHAISRRTDRLRVHHRQDAIVSHPDLFKLSSNLKAIRADAELTPDEKAGQWHELLYPPAPEDGE